MRRGWAPHFAMLLSLDSTGQTLGGAVSHLELSSIASDMTIVGHTHLCKQEDRHN